MEDYPRGFPKLAHFLDSDDAFMVYRRFGTVFSRLLLYKQDEISRKEETLQAMDRYDSNRNDNHKYLMSRVVDVERGDPPKEWPQSRLELIKDLERLCLEYGDSLATDALGSRLKYFAGELLLKARDLKALNEPAQRDYQSVSRFMSNYGGQLYHKESQFITLKDDLVTIRPGREYAWLDGFIEGALRICRCKPLKVSMMTKPQAEKLIVWIVAVRIAG